MDESHLRADAQAILRRLGPLPANELHEHLAEAGHDDVGDARDLWYLLTDEPFEDEPETFSAYTLADGRLADLDHLIDGLVVTHRLTDAERETGEVQAEPDLIVAHILAPDGRHVPLVDGGELTLVGDAFAGPDGWLPDEPVLVLTIRGDAVAITGTQEVPPPDQDVADRLAVAYETLTEAPFQEVPELLVEARARFPKILAEPQAPLSELLELAALTQTDARLHPADEPPDLHRYEDDLVGHLREGHGFDDQQVGDLLRLSSTAYAAANAVLRGTIDLLDPDADPEEVLAVLDTEGLLEDVVDREAPGSLVRLLGETPATVAVLHDVVGSDPLLAAPVLAVLDLVAPDLDDRHAKANAHWLRARLLEFIAEDHAEAERELRRALDADRDHGEAVFDLARYRSDRGEAGAALGLLRQLEGGGDQQWAPLLERFAQPGPTSAGRNEPCPCGSGRKHKACCGPRNGWPLDDRWPWIWDKVWRNTLMPHASEPIEDVLAATGLDDDQLSQPLVSNLVMFEGGAIETFLTTRGSLLPADEQDLLEELAEVRARACEVVDVDPGRGLEVLDLLTGERLPLRDVSMSQQAEVGDVYLLWIVPAGDGLLPWEGGLQVPVGRVDELLHVLEEEDPDDPYPLGEWFRALHAPPELRNSEGEPLVMTTLRIAVPDVDAAWESLAGRLEDDGDQLVDTVEGEDGLDRVRGTVEIDGDTLVVHANSTARAERLHDLIIELVPAAELRDAERIPADEMVRRVRELREDPGAPGATGLGGLDSLDEEDRAEAEAALGRYMADYERRWLDMPVPALGGATPREAADDPTRRGDLERLLRQMEELSAQQGPGRGMDAGRVRAALGMDPQG